MYFLLFLPRVESLELASMIEVDVEIAGHNDAVGELSAGERRLRLLTLVLVGELDVHLCAGKY